MFKRIALALILTLAAVPAWAQNKTCPTRPPGDATNACASTAFVANATGGTTPTTASANQFLGGPISGSPAPPTFRLLDWADIPAFLQPDSHAQARADLAKQQETVSVTDWIPAGTNCTSTDCSTYFQNAATDMCARSPGGSRIFVPPGTYKAHDVNNTCGNIWTGAGSGGVGNVNQTVIASLTKGNTTIDYSAATTYGFQWQVPGFPAFRSSNHINGGGIQYMTLNDGTSTAMAVSSKGTQDWSADHILLNSPYIGFFYKGVEFPRESRVSMYGTRNFNHQVVGDLTGQTSTGTACTTANADCSTRNDVPYFEHIVMIDNTSTSVGYVFTGFVGSPVINDSFQEGPLSGMIVSCPAGGSTSLSNCPEFGRFLDYQVENFHAYGAQLQDFNNFHFLRAYLVGDGSSSNINNIHAASVNYTAAVIPVGILDIDDSHLFASYQDCVATDGTMWDLNITNTKIWGCNIANNNYGAINLTGTLVDFNFHGNTIGEVDGYGGATVLHYAVQMAANTNNGRIDNEIYNSSGGVGYAHWNGASYDAVNAAIINNSNFKFNIHIGDLTYPIQAPTPGTCGSSPSLTSGRDNFFVATVGSSGLTSCTFNFGYPQPAAPICQVQALTNNPVIYVDPPSTTSVTWHGTSLQGGYSVSCHQP